MSKNTLKSETKSKIPNIRLEPISHMRSLCSKAAISIFLLICFFCDFRLSFTRSIDRHDHLRSKQVICILNSHIKSAFCIKIGYILVLRSKVVISNNSLNLEIRQHNGVSDKTVVFLRIHFWQPRDHLALAALTT